MSSGLEFGEEFDLAALLDADPEWVTSIDVTRETALPARRGYLCCGEGSHGSEGFFARLDENRELLWVVYLEQSNPFDSISTDGTNGTFGSTSGLSVTVNLDTPDADQRQRP